MLIRASAVLAAPDWIGARPGSPSLGLTRDRCEGQVRAEAGLARGPTRAPFSKWT